MSKFNVKGIAHITGGGIGGNTKRIIPKGMSFTIDRNSWKVPYIFKYIQKRGNVAEEEMFKTFNMGIGLIVIVPTKEAKKAIRFLKNMGEKAYLVGEVV